MVFFGKAAKNTSNTEPTVVAVVRGRQVDRIVTAQKAVDGAASGADRQRAQAALDAAKRNANQMEINTARENYGY